MEGQSADGPLLGLPPHFRRNPAAVGVIAGEIRCKSARRCSKPGASGQVFEIERYRSLAPNRSARMRALSSARERMRNRQIRRVWRRKTFRVAQVLNRKEVIAWGQVGS